MADNAKGPVEYAVLAGGCFWCVEAVYERIEGVVSAVSGYTGGTVADPSYEQVTTGKTGHAEAVKIAFNPEVISYNEILSIFWKSHDPTSLNKQGADVGTQYRSAIFYADEEQRRIAAESLAKAQESFSRQIVTEITPLDEFYDAEEYHQDYFAKNPYAGYCRVVIAPKLEKLGLSVETY
ncbi:MAG: peptide-methionine (S)-S-oxide reductase MsrA [Spirochaetales bacterium]|nr:peptide-methionine (S)-S-oxide reductase MsrA [Spirochaetales bacterium]